MFLANRQDLGSLTPTAATKAAYAAVFCAISHPARSLHRKHTMVQHALTTAATTRGWTHRQSPPPERSVAVINNVPVVLAVAFVFAHQDRVAFTPKTGLFTFYLNNLTALR